jgi:hypothetical protein
MMGCCKYGKGICCPVIFRATQIVCVDVSYRYGPCFVKLVKSVIAIGVRYLNN